MIAGMNKGWFLLFTVCMLMFHPQVRAEKTEVPQTNSALLPHMQIAYQSLIKVLSFTARGDDPMRSADFQRAADQLKTLSDESKIIHDLVRKDEKGKEYLASELETNTRLAYIRFKAGHADQARFYISDVVNTCFGCHTSRSSPIDSRFTTAFIKDLNQIGLDPLAKARFLSLSRQFEASEDAYEKMFLQEDLDLDEFIHFDPLVEYLILTLRVKDEPERALKTLKALKNRDLPAVVKREISAWMLALKNTENLRGTSAQKAEALMRLGRGSMEFPRDRTGVVEFILASKYLRDSLNSAGLDPKTKAQTYYDLGGCELVLDTSFASDEANVYFGEAIRLAPKSDLARKAYARYEENVYAGYSGSSGVHIPDDERQTLASLKKLAF